MGDIIDYLRSYGQYSFQERKFNPVDALILSQLSYLKFDGLVPAPFEKRTGRKLMDIFVHPDRNGMFADERFEKVNRSLFEAMSFSCRYQKMRLNHYENRIDLEQESQFSAITFYLEGGPIFLAYRGTDETIVGWKEDFNMAFQSPVPSQKAGVEYLNKVGGRLKAPFVVGGHSKGGNVAVYAAIKCQEEVQNKIIGIYNNDGPGFSKKLFTEGEFEKVSGRILKIVPKSSLIGMLLQDEEGCQVVKSTGRGGIGQHDPFTWEVEEGKFVLAPSIDKGQQRLNEAINEWISQLGEEQMEVFVTALYQVVSATEADTLLELAEDWKGNRAKMAYAFKGMDSETKHTLLEVLRAFLVGGFGRKKS